MPTKKQRSPQEKKALSYERDTRNDHGEHDKGVRNTIPARKASEHRLLRRTTKQALGATPTLEDEKQDSLESDLTHEVKRLGRWKKWPGVSLAEVIARKKNK